MKRSLFSTMLFALSSVYLLFVGYAQQPSPNTTFSALFAFGDSILDTGTNNYVITLAKCNFFPYGRDFIGGKATGRFGNGRVITDLIAEGLSLKNLLPPFRDPTLSNNDLLTGVCFASGGSGLDKRTARILPGVIWVPDQVKDFEKYITKLNGVVGNQEKAKAIISNAIYLISAGNNDLSFTYPSRLTQISTSAYTDLMITWTDNFLKSLYDMGARKFAVLGTLPLGCFPLARNRVGNLLKRCLAFKNERADIFNKKLSANLEKLNTTLPDAKFVYVDMYHPILDLINNPHASGFSEADDGCCCMPTSPIPCANASNYVFWDYAHPSEKAYETIAPKIIKDIKDKLA